MYRITIGNVNEIPRGEGRNFRQGAVEVAIFHTQSGELFATRPKCPHAGGPLADGLLGGSILICPLHDRSFDLRTGKNLSGDCADLCVVPLTLEDDGVMVLEISE
jgi:nitrite reductase (NADH) small subunit